jgi:hypothetical protein
MTRNRFLVAAGVTTLVGLACQGSPPPAVPTLQKAAVAAPINPVVTSCNTTAPPNPAVVTFEMATSGLPCTLTFTDSIVNLHTLQQAFDFNSWLTFVSLNEPVDGASMGSNSPTVWQTWADLFSVMLPDGAPPPAFGASVPPPAICTGGPRGTRVLQMISKTPVTPTLQVAGQPLNTGPLIDQNGNYVRYQILINEPMYNYIVANGLYSQAGQQKFTDSIAFPVGAVTSGTTGTIGAIVMKAAWKVLDPSHPADAASGFHTTTAYVYTPAADGVQPSCEVQTLGLVGLHIVHKTDTEPQWIWSTFEHVNNAPTVADAKAPQAGARYNFFNPACDSVTCPWNAQPPQPWNPSVEPFPNGFRSQIVRATKYEDVALQSAAMWNAQFQTAMKGTVWENYHLITTQWPTDAANPTDPDGAPFPLFAANTTMETYVQGNVPQASSTCMGCHGNATSMTGKQSDFSFVLEKAH